MKRGSSVRRVLRARSGVFQALDSLDSRRLAALAVGWGKGGGFNRSRRTTASSALRLRDKQLLALTRNRAFHRHLYFRARYRHRSTCIDIELQHEDGRLQSSIPSQDSVSELWCERGWLLVTSRPSSVTHLSGICLHYHLERLVPAILQKPSSRFSASSGVGSLPAWSWCLLPRHCVDLSAVVICDDVVE